jgi:hypothetical protein
MLPARGTEHRGDIRSDPVRAMVRRPAAVLEAGAARGVKTRKPFVAGLPTDVVAGAELRHRVQPDSVIPDELFSLLHG